MTTLTSDLTTDLTDVTLRRLAYADWLEENGRADEAPNWRDVERWAARGRPQPPTRYRERANQWEW